MAHPRRAVVSTVAILVLILAGAGCSGDASRGEAPRYTTNIYVAEISGSGGEVVVGPPKDVTARPGYDNQPVFLADGRSLLYASRRGDQVDIYRYDADSGEHVPVTRTAEREYQPTPLPEGSGFAAVRVEADGRQRLWRFDDQGGGGVPLVPDIDNVRYYAWAGENSLALVTVAERPNLLLVDLDSQERTTVTDSVQRSIRAVPGRRAISFVREVTVDERWIEMLDLDSGEVTSLVPARPGSEDHTWTPWGTLLMAQDSRLFQWRPGPGAGWEDWEMIADFSLAGVRGLTRLTVNPAGDRLAFVVGEPPKP